MRKSFVAAFCVLIIASSFGASFWANSEGGSWDTASNWDPEGVPTETTDVVISNLNLQTTLTVSRSIDGQKCKSLTIGVEGQSSGLVDFRANAKSQTLTVRGPIRILTDATLGSFSYDANLSTKKEVYIEDGKSVTWDLNKGSCLYYGVCGGGRGASVSLTGSSPFAVRSSSSTYTLSNLYVYVNAAFNLQSGKTSGYRMRDVALNIASGKTVAPVSGTGTSHDGPVKVEGYFIVTNAANATLLKDADNCHMCSVSDTNASFTKAGAGTLTLAYCFGTEDAPWAAPATFEEGGVVFKRGAYITGTLTLGSEGKTFTLTKGTSGEIKANTLVYNGLTLSGYAVNDVVATTVTCPANRCQSVKATIDSTTYDYYLYWEKTAGGYDVTLVDHFIKPEGFIFIVQ